MVKQKKLIIWIGCLMAIIAIATPVFYFVKDFHGFPRSTNLLDWGAFGDYIGGVINPIISLLTLIVTIAIAVNISRIEMRNHVESIHNPVHPFFVIRDGYFYSSDISETGISVEKDYYDYTKPQIPAKEFDHLNKHFYLKVFNKGLGVATDVVCSFEFELEKLSDILKIDDPQIKTTLGPIQTDADGRGFIVLKIDAEERYNYKGFFFKIWAEEKVGLGVVERDIEVPVVVPTQLMGAFKLHNLLRRIKGGELAFPELHVSFKYKNIFGKEITSKFRIGLFHVNDYSSYSVFRISQEQV